jgi:nucleotide-binding universal stress UspA family protein
MFSTIAIGVDGRTGGRDALALAVRLAGRDRARLVAVHVAHAARAGSPIDARPYEALLQRELARAGVVADTLVVGHEFAGDGLRRAVSRLGADLLVIGSSHRAGIGRVLRGHTARTALHGITCPVAIASHGMHAATSDHRTIGVGFDGSPGARDALAVAAELARPDAAALRVVAVGEPLDRLPAMAPDGEPWCPPEEQRAAGSRAMVAEAVDAVAATGVDISGDVVPGFARDGLQRLSDEVDLLVVGSCRYGPLGRLVLGSTAEHLLDTAHCPVLVVPRHAAQAADTAAA